MPVREEHARRDARRGELPHRGTGREVVGREHQLEPDRQGEDEDGDRQEVAREAEEGHEPEAERQPEVRARRRAIAVQSPPRPEHREGRRDDGQRRDRPDRAQRSERSHEEVTQGSKERVRAEVRGENEEALLEGRRREPMAHGDQPRVGWEVLEGERVEQPEDEGRGEGQPAEGEPARALAQAERPGACEHDAEVRRDSCRRGGGGLRRHSERGSAGVLAASVARRSKD